MKVTSISLTNYYGPAGSFHCDLADDTLVVVKFTESEAQELIARCESIFLSRRKAIGNEIASATPAMLAGPVDVDYDERPF